MRHLLYLIAGTLSALLISLAIVIIGLNPPDQDIQQLLLFMGGSGLTTIIAVYLLYKQVLIHWVNSLRWSLIFTVVTTVLLVFLNVWGTAQLMYINNHDLILTAALLVFGGLTAIAFGLYIANSIAHKIQDISYGVEQLAAGDFDARIHVQGQDELAKLGNLLNWTAQRLQEIEQEKQQVEQTRRDLIAWISHDLRTPLTAIQASLEAIKDGVATEPAQVEGYLRTSLSEVDNLRDLISDLFAIAQMDAGHVDVKLVSASLSDLISDTVASMIIRANNRNITIHGEIASDIDPIHMAPEKIQRVLYNLIDNAIRHTPQHGQITIRAHRVLDAVRVEVHNTGSHIPLDQQPQIFDKFYRADNARPQEVDGHRGTGLGLAIARGFVEAHNGQIRVESSPARGTCFAFSIPVRSPTTRN